MIYKKCKIFTHRHESRNVRRSYVNISAHNLPIFLSSPSNCCSSSCFCCIKRRFTQASRLINGGLLRYVLDHYRTNLYCIAQNFSTNNNWMKLFYREVRNSSNLAMVHINFCLLFYFNCSPLKKYKPLSQPKASPASPASGQLGQQEWHILFSSSSSKSVKKSNTVLL